MIYSIILSPEAISDLQRLDANRRSLVKAALEKYLRHEPGKLSKSRIKRLKGLSQPQYRLRIDEIRVFYDINESAVEILAIVSKSDVLEWLEKAGEKIDEESPNK